LGLIYKVLLYSIVLSIFIHAQDFIDEDLDGVDDRIDKCPNSSLFDIVDSTGCAIKHLKVKVQKISSYDISIGFNSIKYKDNTYSSETISFSYYYKDFNLNIFNSFSKEGIEDITLEFVYKFKRYHKIGLGFYLPNSDFEGNNLDYFIKYKYSYEYKKIDFSLLYKYIFMRDRNTQNSNTFIVSCGYEFNSNWYSSVSYSYETSIYKDEPSIKTFSLFLNYSINEHIYINTSFSKNFYSFNIGYSF